MDKPSVGRVVHYVDNNGVKHHAAMITEVDESGFGPAIGVVSLFVMSKYGHEAVIDAPHSEAKEPGSWHWPERV